MESSREQLFRQSSMITEAQISLSYVNKGIGDILMNADQFARLYLTDTSAKRREAYYLFTTATVKSVLEASFVGPGRRTVYEHVWNAKSLLSKYCDESGVGPSVEFTWDIACAQMYEIFDSMLSRYRKQKPSEADSLSEITAVRETCQSLSELGRCLDRSISEFYLNRGKIEKSDSIESSLDTLKKVEDETEEIAVKHGFATRLTPQEREELERVLLGLLLSPPRQDEFSTSEA